MKLAIVALTFTVAACTGMPPTSPPPAPTLTSPAAGGTLRVVLPRGEPFSSSIALPAPDPASDEPDPRLSVLDPHVDVWYDVSEVLRCCLARTLLATNGLSAEKGGATVQPDLAATMPEISSDGLAWTFTIRPGIRYGPPLGDVEVTAADFVRSFHRLLLPELGTVGQEIFADVIGAQEYAAGEATSISGLEADDHTLVIRLTAPAGDLGARLALPMTAPLPPKPAQPNARLGVADGHTLPRPQDEGPSAIGVYGRFLVSSGPYMLAGSEGLDFSVPAAQQTPASGVSPGESITLVRNPNWDHVTDPLRPARPDRIEIYVAESIEAAVAELNAGRADLVVNPSQAPTVPPASAAEFQREPSRGSVHLNEFGGIRGLEMNVAQPPFDDLHVRKAVNLILDKSRIIDLHGGPFAFRVADHMAPDAVLNNLLVDYAPYATPGDHGDLDAAKAEMAQSRYDTDGDGVCDDGACSDVRALTREPYPPIAEVVRANLTAIGVDLAVETLSRDDFFAAYYDPTQLVGMYVPLGWATSTLGPEAFFERYYSPYNAGAGSLVGSTAEQLEEWGYDSGEVASVDDRIEACIPLTGAQQFECWASLDQHIMENVAPLAPYGSELFAVLASRSVVEYAFDQSQAAPAFDHIVVSR